MRVGRERSLWKDKEGEGNLLVCKRRGRRRIKSGV